MSRRYFVSRQHYWDDGRRVVEVVAGGADYANADMLAPQYAGEAEEYEDPREAVEAAIAICRAWRRDAGDRSIQVAVGATGGFTMPLEGMTFAEAREWAEEEFERLPKCDECGDVLGRESYTLTEDPDAGHFCSERCADEFLAELEEDDEDLEDGDDAR